MNWNLFRKLDQRLRLGRRQLAPDEHPNGCLARRLRKESEQSYASSVPRMANVFPVSDNPERASLPQHIIQTAVGRQRCRSQKPRSMVPDATTTAGPVNVESSSVMVTLTIPPGTPTRTVPADRPIEDK